MSKQANPGSSTPNLPGIEALTHRSNSNPSRTF